VTRAEAHVGGNDVAKIRDANATHDEALDALLDAELTELATANYLVDLYGERLRFCKRRGGWLVYDGRRWAEDKDGEIFRLAEGCVKKVAEGARKLDDARCRKALAFAIQAHKRRVMENIIAIARNDARVAIGDPDRFDADRYLLNVKNGTLELRTGTLREHRAADLLTKIVEIPYQSEAQCSRFERFLCEVFSNDEELVAFVQRAIGYSLTGDTSEQCFLILYGNGANGKSTVLRVIGELLGDYATVASTETFVSRRHQGPSNDLARLHGARFVSAVETTEGAALNEGFVKAVTGGDRILARYLFCEHFVFVPQFKLLLAVNHKPQIRGTDEAIWRRVRLVPFERSFTGEGCDQHLIDELAIELPGILAWALRGCLEWQRSGLGQPVAVRTATATYRAESDVIAQFVEECCTIGGQFTVGSTPLFERWQKWCETNGERGNSKKAFASRLKAHGNFDNNSQDGNGRKRWLGIGLLEEPNR
jgi:putative DNA primase/helicase